MNRLLTLLTILTITNVNLKAQTTLSSGDIAVVGMNGHGGTDGFTFVTLVDLEAGTTILFTTIAANNTYTLPSSGGVVKYTAPSGGLPVGSVVEWSSTNPTANNFSEEVSGFSISNNGDNVTAYQGSGLNVTTFLHVAGTNGTWGTIPGGFSNITDLGTAQDAKYSGVRNSTIADLRSRINNVANWTTANNGILPFTNTKFRLGYYWDGASWYPSDPSGASISDPIIISTSGAVFTGNVTTTGNVFIDSSGSLDLGANTLTADTVSIESTAGGQGQLMGDVSGVVKFESYVAAASARWFNVGSPVGGTLADMQFSNNGKINTLADVAGDTNFVNIWYYDTDLLNSGNSEGTWRPVASKSALADTAGYSIYLGSPFGTLPMTITTYGTLNNGAVSTPISTANGGYNFINNPYATSIDFDAVVTDNSNLNGTYYIFDAEAGSYISYSAPAGSPATRRYIGPGQAFFVNAGTATQVDFASSQQTMTESISIASGAANPGIMLNVTTIDGYSDYTYVGLKQGVSDQFNTRYDGKKIKNTGLNTPNFYSELSNEQYVFKFIDDNFIKKSIPMNFEHSQNGSMVIDASIMSINPYWFIELEDKLTGTITNLRYSNYQFNHDQKNDPDRFVLHISQSSVGVEDHSVDGVYAFTKDGRQYADLTPVATSKTVEFMVYDLTGKLVLNSKHQGGTIVELKMDQQATGIYMLQVIDNNQLIHSQKLLKQ